MQHGWMLNRVGHTDFSIPGAPPLKKRFAHRHGAGPGLGEHSQQPDLQPGLYEEDPLEKEMANHSIILPFKILRTEEYGRLQSIRMQNSWRRFSDLTITIVFIICYILTY